MKKICEEQVINIHLKHECCKGRKRTLDKNIMKFMYPSLSQEVFDTLSPKIQVCTDIYMDCNKKKEHNALIQDENIIISYKLRMTLQIMTSMILKLYIKIILSMMIL